MDATARIQSTATRGMTRLLAAAITLARDLEPDGDDPRSSEAAERLRASVVRPLERVTPRPRGRSAKTPAASPGERLWELAGQATALRAEPEPANELLEATAALQDLAYRFASADDPGAADERLAELRQLQSG